MRITVFTPTYNRVHTLEQLYRSIQRQNFSDFEWVVVDDGSVDDTEQFFQRIMAEENPFPIRYIKTVNGGKHRAINRGVAEAKGELFLIVDSDDYLTDDALAGIDRVEKTIPSNIKDQFAGICGQKGFAVNCPIGESFEGDVLDITSLERGVHGINGDKAETFYTEILRRFPFPTFEGENFITECVIWDKIAEAGLKLRFYNEIMMICNYRSDGLSAQGEELFLRSPRGYGLYLYQSRENGKIVGLSMWNRYLRFYYATKHQYSFRQISDMLHMNSAVLWCRLFVLRVIYKLYGG